MQGSTDYWLPVEDEDAWALVTVTRGDGGKISAVRSRAPEGMLLEMSISEDELKPLRPMREGFEAPSDLVALPSISTASVLHTLRTRYDLDQIYTSVGPVIIAVNPFRPTKEGSEDRIDALARMAPDDLPPHVFNVARSAYTVMVATGGAQSILISGESGAGKTESAKLCMTCLALLSASPAAVTSAALESGLLLEAFGNAKTVYNDNSSRFGKWVEVRFDKKHSISSCFIRSYLLEISRVVHQAPGERNYHIFCQLLVGATAAEKERFGLPAEALQPTDYAYTRGSVTSPTDATMWAETQRTLAAFGIDGATIGDVGRVLSAVLTLGNVEFEAAADDDDAHHGARPKLKERRSLQAVAAIVGVGAEELEGNLLERLIVSGRGTFYNTPYTAAQSADARDALAKDIFLRLFEWLVTKLNSHMQA